MHSYVHDTQGVHRISMYMVLHGPLCDMCGDSAQLQVAIRELVDFCVGMAPTYILALTCIMTHLSTEFTSLFKHITCLTSVFFLKVVK